MGLEWIRVSLQGYGGPEPSGTVFFDQIGIRPSDGFPTSASDSEWEAARVLLVNLTMDECRDAPEPTEAFVARLDAGLRRAGEWLLSRPIGVLERWQSSNRKADVFVAGWLDGEQLDLAFPAVFLLACGQAGLPIVICTNDRGNQPEEAHRREVYQWQAHGRLTDSPNSRWPSAASRTSTGSWLTSHSTWLSPTSPRCGTSSTFTCWK